MVIGVIPIHHLAIDFKSIYPGRRQALPIAVNVGLVQQSPPHFLPLDDRMPVYTFVENVEWTSVVLYHDNESGVEG